MLILPYARRSAVAYARRWALARNPRWYNFDALGGDCTNFVSQCLFAGSGIMNLTPETGWYYLSLNNRTPSWTGVEFLYQFLNENTSVGPFGRLVNMTEAVPGDVIQLGDASGDFYHSLIIVSVRPRILVAAHTIDSLDRPLDSYDYDQIRFIHIEGVRIW